MVNLFLSGDVMTGRGVDQILAHPVDPTLHEPYVKDARRYVELAEQESGEIAQPVGDRYIWGFALEKLEEMDPAARIINLETAVTASDDYWRGKGINYRMSPENLGSLTAANVDCCTLANNHVLDWGYPGLTETLESLQDAGLKTVGAGQNEAAAEAPAALSTNAGPRILVYNWAMPGSGVPEAWAARESQPGVAFLPDYSEQSFAHVAQTIGRTRSEESDIVIFSIHWGGNWGFRIPDRQRQFAHRLIDEAGIDVVHGHSSHHVKGIEVYRNRLILYGCGDLVTDYEGISGRQEFRGELGLLYFPQLDPETGSLQNVWLQPTKVQQMQLRRPPAEDLDWLQNTLNRESRSFGAKIDRRGDGVLQLRWED